MDLNADDVRSFLLRNSDFTEEFFICNATQTLVDKWFEHRSKGNHINGHVYCKPGVSNGGFASLYEEENQEVTQSVPITPSFPDKQGGSRRFSEPDAATRTEKKTAFKLRDMRKKALTQHRLHSSPLDTSFDAAKPLTFNKPSLRKTQSAPICKNMLSRLINSTVYLRNFPTQNLRYKLDLRSSSKDAFLTEIIHDIIKDLNLRTLCYKVIVNVGIITDADIASLYLIEKVEQKKVLRICYENLEVGMKKIENGVENRDLIKSVDQIRNLGEDLIGRVAETGETIRRSSFEQVFLLIYLLIY